MTQNRVLDPHGLFTVYVAPLEAWPKIGDRAVVTPLLQTIETATCGLSWKAALESSRELAVRSGWLFVIGLRALDCEVVALWSKRRELGLYKLPK